MGRITEDTTMLPHMIFFLPYIKKRNLKIQIGYYIYPEYYLSIIREKHKEERKNVP